MSSGNSINSGYWQILMVNVSEVYNTHHMYLIQCAAHLSILHELRSSYSLQAVPPVDHFWLGISPLVDRQYTHHVCIPVIPLSSRTIRLPESIKRRSRKRWQQKMLRRCSAAETYPRSSSLKDNTPWQSQSKYYRALKGKVGVQCCVCIFQNHQCSLASLHQDQCPVSIFKEKSLPLLWLYFGIMYK